MYKEKFSKTEETIQNYFEGVFYGNVEKLRKSFSPNALLYGDIKGQEYYKSLADYLDGVQNRKSPHELGEDFRMDILSTEILGNVAVAKVHVPMLGYNYYDFLSLCLISNEWKIVNKIFTHVE